MKGWISLYRKLSKSDLWTAEKFTRGQAWVDLLLLANHKPGYIYVRGHKITIKRGQVGWSENRLADRWKWSRTKVRNFLKDLKNEQQIRQEKNRSYSVITIINYDFYQNGKQEKEQQENKRKTREEQEKDTNNNDNNVNNDNNITPAREKRPRKKSGLIEDLDRVKRMDKPLTPEQGEKLVQEYGKEPVKNILVRMENWKPLLKKNTSTYLTAKNWLKRNNENNASKGNKVLDGGTWS